MVLTRSPARIQSDSLSTASLRRTTLSSIRVMVISSSEGLSHQSVSIRATEKDCACACTVNENTLTHRPLSYSPALLAMGEISEWIVIVPSSGLSGWGFTIVAVVCASTLAQPNRLCVSFYLVCALQTVLAWFCPSDSRPSPSRVRKSASAYAPQASRVHLA